jgi:hypothetical protein
MDNMFESFSFVSLPAVALHVCRFLEFTTCVFLVFSLPKGRAPRHS